jgi:hypothetical protein
VCWAVRSIAAVTPCVHYGFSSKPKEKNKMAILTPDQLKELKFTLGTAKSDWQYATEVLYVSSIRNEELRASAQRSLWLVMTDKCYEFGIEIPEYAESNGMLRELVDAEAADAASCLMASQA